MQLHATNNMQKKMANIVEAKIELNEYSKQDEEKDQVKIEDTLLWKCYASQDYFVSIQTLESLKELSNHIKITYDYRDSCLKTVLIIFLNSSCTYYIHSAQSNLSFKFLSMNTDFPPD